MCKYCNGELPLFTKTSSDSDDLNSDKKKDLFKWV